MRAKDLVAAIDRLPYSIRNARLAEEVRGLAGTPAVRTLLGELAEAGPFEQRLGVLVAAVAHEPWYVERMLAGADVRVQSATVRVAARMPTVSDDALAECYDDAPAWLRQVLARAVRKGRRHELAERLAVVARDRWGAAAAAALLPACGQDVVTRLLPELCHVITAGGWRRLGASHTEVVLDYAARTLPRVPDGRAQAVWWAREGWLIAGAAEREPGRVLALVERWAPERELPEAVVAVLGRLQRVDPAAVLRLLTATERQDVVRHRRLPATVLRRLRELDDEQIALLGRVYWPDTRQLAALLRRLPPPRRAGVFAAVTADVDLTQTALADDILELLPHAERHRMARQALTLRQVRESTTQTWRLTAHLPFREGFQTLAAEARRPDPDSRAAIFRLVVSCAGRSHDPAAVGEVLTWLDRLRNEQDPVRMAALDAVAALPPSLLTAAHVPMLDVIVADALAARDVSWPTLRAVGSLATTALRQGATRDVPALADWGLNTSRRLAASTGSLSLNDVCDGLPRGREHALYAVLTPHVEAAATREDFDLVFAVARAFGKRARGVPALQEAIEPALRSSNQATVTTAVRLWLEPPASRDERVERLLDRDLRMARSDAVWQAVTTRRTDLLDRILSEPGPTRRFDRHGWWDVPPSALGRWLPRQHAAYARLLAVVASDSRRPEAMRASAVRMLGRVPGQGYAALAPFLDSPDLPIQEAALAALAWTDQPASVIPRLLEHIGDDRARVVTPGLSRCARYVAPSRLGGLLEPVLVADGAKVTVRKEAARLLAELHAPGAVAALRRAWDSAHVDVRAAIIGVLARCLHTDPDAWPLLAGAAVGQPACAAALLEIWPYDLPEAERSRFGALVVQATANSDRDVAVRAFSSLPAWGPWAAEAPAACRRTVTDLDAGPQLWQAAARALAQTGDVDVSELVAAVRALGDDDTESAGQRDLPARRRLSRLVAELVEWSGRRGERTRPVLRAAADVLRDAPDYVAQRRRLLVAALPLADPAAALDELADLVADRPVEAVRAAALLGETLDAGRSRWRPTGLVPAVARLTARGDLAGGLLAVTLTARAGKRLRWPKQWRERLTALRRATDPDVRCAALDVSVYAE